MNKLTMIAAVAVGSAITGCRSFDPPMELEQTARDAEVYKTEAKVPMMPRQKVVIITKDATPKGMQVLEAEKYVQNKMESSLTEYFTNLGNVLDTIDRKNGLTIDSEAILSGDKNGVDPSKVAGADYILIAETSYRWQGGLAQAYKFTFDPQKGVKLFLKTNFRMISTATKETIVSKSAESMAEYERGTGGWQAGVNATVNANAKLFAKLVSARMLPPAKVRQTRGDGWAAQISMGKNYMAEPGETVEFLSVEEDGPVPFARGTVFSADDKSSWIEVTNYKKAGVRKGHFVKLVAEDKVEK